MIAKKKFQDRRFVITVGQITFLIGILLSRALDRGFLAMALKNALSGGALLSGLQGLADGLAGFLLAVSILMNLRGLQLSRS
ncbi:MAG: hypothetical protein PVG14_15130 [Anaerolineales bacterium]|jgi:hypothetical protein